MSGILAQIRKLLPAAARTAGLKALWLLLIALLNPFQVVEWSEARSRSLWQQLSAPYYEPPLGDQRFNARDEITVVYLSDPALTSVESIITLLNYAIGPSDNRHFPHAIFVDIFLNGAAAANLQISDFKFYSESERHICEFSINLPRDQQLRCLVFQVAELTKYDAWKDKEFCQSSPAAKMQCILDHAGIPVIFAELADSDKNVSRTKVAAYTDPAVTALNTVAITAPVEVDQLQYPLVTYGRNHKIQISPAALLYSVYCHKSDANCSEQPIIPPKSESGAWGWSEKYATAIDVAWATGRRSDFSAMRERVEGSEVFSACTFSSGAWTEWFFALGRVALSGLNFPNRQPCNYTNSIDYDFLSANASKSDLLKLFDNRLLLIGSNFESSNDFVDTSVYGQIPGVFYHAMATDNLIQKRHNYTQRSSPIFDLFDISYIDLFTVIMSFFIIMILQIIFDFQFEPLSQHGIVVNQICVLTLKTILMTSMISMTIAFVTGQLRLIPANFNLAVIVLVCIFIFIEFLSQLMRPSLLTTLARAERMLYLVVANRK